MKLRCIRDNCPETGRLVDMRRCCGAHSWSKPCKHYGRKPWTEYTYVTCAHPHARAQTQALQDYNSIAPDVDKKGSFCSFDVKKSQEDAHSCKVLVERLKAFWG